MRKRVAWGAGASILLATLVAGCGGGESGPSDEAIQAEIQAVLQAFQKHVDGRPQDEPRFHTDETLYDLMGRTAYRYIKRGFRMRVAASWQVGAGRTARGIGLTLMHMGTPEGAQEVMAMETEGLKDVPGLGPDVTARRGGTMLAFTRGPYYAELADTGEVEGPPALLQDAGQALAEAFAQTKAPAP